jgi:L-fucose mutarotase/ribose pyranase (RbsD/FucU family)
MTVLKGIPRILNPRLLHVLASMGHGDELVRASTVCAVCALIDPRTIEFAESTLDCLGRCWPTPTSPPPPSPATRQAGSSTVTVRGCVHIYIYVPACLPPCQSIDDRVDHPSACLIIDTSSPHHRHHHNHAIPGHDIPTLLTAILQLLPLDQTAPPAMVMGMVRPSYASTRRLID